MTETETEIAAGAGAGSTAAIVRGIGATIQEKEIVTVRQLGSKKNVSVADSGAIGRKSDHYDNRRDDVSASPF